MKRPLGGTPGNRDQINRNRPHKSVTDVTFTCENRLLTVRKNKGIKDSWSDSRRRLPVERS